MNNLSAIIDYICLAMFIVLSAEFIYEGNTHAAMGYICASLWTMVAVIRRWERRMIG